MTGTRDLEDKCRALVDRRSTPTGPAKHIADEVAVTLGQLDEVRNHTRQLEERLTESELNLRTRILNLKTPIHEYNWDRWARRKQMVHQLEGTLVKLEQQIQRLATDRERRVHALQDRLLDQWSKWEQVSLA